MKLKKLCSLDFVKKFESYLNTDFERELYRASLRNYASYGNPLRFHNFAYSLRSLIDHIIAKRSPDKEIKKCPWYKKEHAHYDVSRRQHLKYCAQFKISDEYLGEEFLEQSNDEISYMLKLYSTLSNFTHINEKSLRPDPIRFFEDAKNVLKTATNILSGIERCKRELIDTLEDKIREAVIDTASNSVPEELINIANHAYIDDTEIEGFDITSIDDEFIYISAHGIAYVTQEYGPKNDGATISEDYPFTLRMVSHVDSPETFEVVSDALEVDTSSWYDDGEQEAQMMEMERSAPQNVPMPSYDFEADESSPF